MNKGIKIDVTVRELLTLCHIIDEYENFIKELHNFLQTKKGEINYVLIDKLIKVSRNKRCFNSKKAKEFYNENKSIIDAINEHSTLNSFVYGYFGVYIDKKDKIEYMYNYLVKNIDKMDNIIKLLEKIKNLGIREIVFNEEQDFTKESYILSNHYREKEFQYLDNMVTIPNYNNKVFKYTTKSSNYKINFHPILKKIELNSLVFDIDRLPDSIDGDELYDKILSLKVEIGDESVIVNNAVEISICIDDLASSITDADRIINSLTATSSKEELASALSNIKQELVKMRDISIAYNTDVITNNQHITEEILTEEKAEEQNKRKIASFIY